MPDYSANTRSGNNEVGYYVVLGLITLAAAAFALLSFDDSLSQGVRAILLYLTPAAWGFFAYRALSGQPEAFEKLSDVGLPFSGVVAGLVVGSALILDAPLALANLALGAEAAFIMVMLLDEGQGGFTISKKARTVGLAVMLMLTTISLMVAVAI